MSNLKWDPNQEEFFADNANVETGYTPKVPDEYSDKLNKAYSTFEAEADNTRFDVLKDVDKTKIEDRIMQTFREDDLNLFSPNTNIIHNALSTLGMTPGVGIAADIMDAGLYLLEGEYGDAALSTAAAIPVVGQLASGRKLLKAAKQAGEKTVTFYRGIPKWYKGKMVADKKYVGGGEYVGNKVSGIDENALWVSTDKGIAKRYAGKAGEEGVVLEFEVPESVYLDNLVKTAQSPKGISGIFPVGLDKKFLKKVHK